MKLLSVLWLVSVTYVEADGQYT